MAHLSLDYLVHVRILLVVFQPIRKWYYRLVHRLADLSFLDSSELEEIGLDEVEA